VTLFITLRMDLKDMQAKEIRPLICSPSPRDIPEVRVAWDTLPCDKFLVKYQDEKTAYKLLRDFFLEHNEYTHMVICPDDLIVTKEVFKILSDDQTVFNYPVLAGICNLSWQQMDTYSCCRKVSGFQFLTEKELTEMRVRSNDPQLILHMGHEAFACSWMRRDVVEKIPLEGMNEGHHFDWAFSIACRKYGVMIHVDTSARMLHLKNRLGNGLLENSGVGIKAPTTIYEKA
jgi:hypothetical protein